MMNKDWTDKLPSLLEGLEEAAPEGLWDAVQAGVTPTRRRRAAGWWFAAAALAVAATVVLVVFLWVPADTPMPGAPVAHVSVSPVPEDRLADNLVSESLPTVPEMRPVAPKSLVPCSSAPISALETPQVPDSCLSAPVLAEETPQVPDSCLSAKPTPEREQNDPLFYMESPPPASKQRKGSWQVGVSGGGLLAQASHVSTGIGLPIAVADTKDATIPFAALTRNAASTTEARHRQGLRGSVLVSYRFAPRWSVGTGLSMSSLISEFTTTAENSTQVTLQNTLYLGVPLYAQFNVLQFDRFQLYLTSGPMVELPLYQHVSTRRLAGNQLIESTTTPSQVTPFEARNWRWSVNLAAGLQYQLFSHGALFLQPGVCWHIPGQGGQEDFYSSRPVAFDLNLGFRFLLF